MTWKCEGHFFTSFISPFPHYSLFQLLPFLHFLSVCPSPSLSASSFPPLLYLFVYIIFFTISPRIPSFFSLTLFLPLSPFIYLPVISIYFLVSPLSTSHSLPAIPLSLSHPHHPFLSHTLTFHFFLGVSPASRRPLPPLDPGLPSPPYKPRMMEWEHNKRQQEPCPHPARGTAPSIDVIPLSSEGGGAGGGGGGCDES